MQCIRVDLPEPDGPMTAVNSPAAKSIDTPSSAATVRVALAVHLADARPREPRPTRGLGGGCASDMRVLFASDPVWMAE